MILVEWDTLRKRLNPYCTQALITALGFCVQRGHYEITIGHVLLTLLEDTDCDVGLILRHYTTDRDRLRRAVLASLESMKTGNPQYPASSELLYEWIQDAWLLSSIELGLTEIRSGVLLAALILKPHRYAMELSYDFWKTIPRDTLRRDFLTIVASSKEEAPLPQTASSAVSSQSTARDDSALGRFTIDFTGKAQAGAIDPVFCRDRELRQMIDILGRRRKNNPILVGEAGVGKTAVVEGLALKIVQGDVPDMLQGVALYGLDLGLLQAGAGVRGEFENRLKAVIAEIQASPTPVILFIDEAHMLIGAGGSAGGGDAANLLKPALARGELRTIAATTWAEYKKYFEKDAALARRFQPVTLDEPSPTEAISILRGLRATYEVAHGVYIRDDAIVAAAQLSARYLSGRQLPDKAVDVLDTASARVKIGLSARPDTIDGLAQQLQTLEREQQALRRDLDTGQRSDTSRLAELDTEIQASQAELATLTKRWEEEREATRRVLTLRQQLAVFSHDSLAANATSVAETSPPAVSPSPQTTVTSSSLRQELEQALAALAALQGNAPLLYCDVTPAAVGQVIADWTGIPVGNMVKDEAQTLLQFRDRLQQRIKGQEHAITTIDRRLRAAKTGLGSPHMPLGVFLFVGPSGVGKTECALGIADLLFGGERFIITINMSEFQEKHTVSRLIGSPPGYVGYGEGGVLTEAVRQRPYAVVLLDEVEKADPEVLNLFYQVFDKGTLADGEGRVIDFRNTVICMTSNLASDVITQRCAREPWPDPDMLTATIRPVLRAHFKPALLARMDVVPFYAITDEAMRSIAELKLQQLAARLQASHKIRLVYDDEVVHQIVLRCTEVESGARTIDHIMRGTLLPEMATVLLHMLGTSALPQDLVLEVAPDGQFTYRLLP